jgi:hypothetical protein
MTDQDPELRNPPLPYDPYLVTVTFNRTVSGPVWDVQPPTLYIDSANPAIYFTISAFSASDTDLKFTWNNGDGAPTPPELLTDEALVPGPFQTVVAFENHVTGPSQRYAYKLWDEVLGKALISHDPEIVLEPPPR